MSDQEVSVRERLSGQLRRLQRAAAVLACIQYVAEYEEEFEFSLADAVSVVLELVEDVGDAVSLIASEIEAEVRP
ncbi:hypothetical protein [Steroidobacter agaridevorans]|uniref:hypothetical protein n=1 Tax=Steroidobacter agaridevorans TaxID=2695856 RepID=UPI001325C7E7|nr:hypothetical protein [Steroidobacter agaridevorans]GFE86732.1 hypothetical protein GCM10011488_16860 [Steroidobacter agaridevorans]